MAPLLRGAFIVFGLYVVSLQSREHFCSLAAPLCNEFPSWSQVVSDRRRLLCLITIL